MADHALFPNAASEATLSVLLDEMERLVSRIAEQTNIIGSLSTDIGGRLRVNAELLGTLSTITTVTTVATVTNQAQVGGVPANSQIYALERMAENALRMNIT